MTAVLNLYLLWSLNNLYESKPSSASTSNWKHGVIVESVAPRSYIVEVDGRKYRRNLVHLRDTIQSSQSKPNKKKTALLRLQTPQLTGMLAKTIVLTPPPPIACTELKDDQFCWSCDTVHNESCDSHPVRTCCKTTLSWETLFNKRLYYPSQFLFP